MSLIKLLPLALGLFAPSSLGQDTFLPTLSDNSPKTWPAPSTNGGTSWSSAYSKAKSLVAKMTLDEKTALITGQDGRCVGNTGAIPRLDIPSLCLMDGPAGVRPVQGVSQFPAGIAVGATWDRKLMHDRGQAMGQEFADMGVNIALSPVTGGPLGRAPRMGRNWEGFASDPYLTGEASYETVIGLQSAGTLATSKHWIGYEQETFRNPKGASEPYAIFHPGEQRPISANMDDKSTHELYMWGFAEAVRAGASYVMCSYNEINQTHACANAYTQNNLLKGELGFAGGIMSDWGGVWGEAEFINGGLDIDMPGIRPNSTSWGPLLHPLVQNGTIKESRIDDAAIRLLTPYLASGQVKNPLPSVPFSASRFTQYPVTPRDVRQSETAALIRQIARDSATLLKNERNALPMKKGQYRRVAVIGADAGDNALGPLAAAGHGAYPINNMNGTLTLGGGSGWAIPPYIISGLEGVSRRARQDGAQIWPVLNNTAYDIVNATAAGADIALVFVSAWATENHDRPNLHLDRDGETLIQTTAAASNNTVVIIHSGGQVDVEAWIEHPNVTAVIFAHYPGQEAGDAIADILYGDVSPSGKMPYTTARKEEDYVPGTIVADPVKAPQAYFNESTLIDYRWFAAKNITPRFEFGFGLSYSNFSYAKMVLKSINVPDTKAIQKTNEKHDGSGSLYDVVLRVTAQIKNSGKVEASEVAQLYFTLPDAPALYLRGFQKLQKLKAGEERTATFELRRKDLSEWDVVRQMWVIPAGKITIAVGSSATKIHLTKTWSK